MTNRARATDREGHGGRLARATGAGELCYLCAHQLSDALASHGAFRNIFEIQTGRPRAEPLPVKRGRKV